VKILSALLDWVDSRLGVRDIARSYLTGYLLPRNINVWYSLGSVILTLFTLQFATGLLLLIHYVPETEKAFASVETIVNEVPFGWLVRNLHVVGANVVVIALLLHMLSVLFMGSYKRPRELTWVVGMFLLLLSLGMCLTGYLLPWSQLSYWATTIATEAPGSLPVVGEFLVNFLRGASGVGQETLGRFFALHVLGFPLLICALIGLHLFCILRIGISSPPFGDGSPPSAAGRFRHQDHPGGIPFFPNFVVEELAVISFFLAALTAVTVYAPTLFLPSNAFVPADPFVTPEGIKPEWYFLWAYQTLKIFPSKAFGLGVQGAGVLFLILLPFFDRSLERNPLRRPLFLIDAIFGFVLLIALSIWGHYS